MNRLIVLTAAVAVLAGALAGYVWWRPPGPSGEELRDARSSVERLGQQLDEARAQREKLEAQLEAEKARRETLQVDLRREKEVNARLHLLLSEGRK
jgi:hypothetical protein